MSKVANVALRGRISSNHLYLWQVAAQIGVAEMTLIRWLRTELSGERLERVERAIAQLTEGDENG